MKTSHKILLASAAVLPMLGAGGLVASAATDTSNPHDTLIQKLVTKFNLQESEVRSVIDEAHAERKAQMETEFSDKLSSAVTSGELTQAQADLITAKRAELASDRENNKAAFENLSKEERQTKMKETRDSLKTWAEENDIDMKWLAPGKGRGHSAGMMGMRGDQ